MELFQICTFVFIFIQLSIKFSEVSTSSQLLDEDIEHVLGDGITDEIDPLGSVYHVEEEQEERSDDSTLSSSQSSFSKLIDAAAATATTTTPSSISPQQQQTTTPSPPTPNCVVSGKLNTTEKLMSSRNEVKLVNGSYLTRTLSDSAPLECFLVLFYVPWCPFSARLAPLYNALPKAFPTLDILAFDVSKSIGYNTKFGTSAVPMVLLFQHKNVLAKFNYTEKNLTEFIEFVSLKTGFKGNKSIEVDEEDLAGPVPTVAQKRFDYFLFLSWLFLIVVSLDYSIRKTRLRVYVMRWLRRLGMWLRGINNNDNMPELDEPGRLQAIENAANNQQQDNNANANHPHND